MNRLATLAVSIVVASAAFLPIAAQAQMSQTSQLVITTQHTSAVVLPVVSPTITVTATGPSLSSLPTVQNMLSFASNFAGDTRTITFVPGSYSVAVSGPSGMYYEYSADCSGFTPLSGTVRYCTITATNIPPAQPTLCGGWYGNGCPIPTVPYVGVSTPNTLTCAPAYQTVSAGQAATFTVLGGTALGNSWTTADRTFLNIGPSLSTVFQSTGVQTVVVSNGNNTASCTVNVVSTGGPIVYPGTTSFVGTYIPHLPNTGFAPMDAQSLAIMAVLLIAAAIAAYPYVRKNILAFIR